DERPGARPGGLPALRAEHRHVPGAELRRDAARGRPRLAQPGLSHLRGRPGWVRGPSERGLQPRRHRYGRGPAGQPGDRPPRPLPLPQQPVVAGEPEGRERRDACRRDESTARGELPVGKCYLPPMPKIDVPTAPLVRGSKYPAPFDEPCRTRENRQLGIAARLTQVRVTMTRLPPGAWSSQRHFHEREDEFIWVLEGEVVLVDDAGEQVLRAGDCAGFPAGERNGHHLQNRAARDAILLTVGTRDPADHGEDPDIDRKILPGRYSGGGGDAHKDGTRYRS